MAAILVVEDDPHVLELLRVCIELEGHQVFHCLDGACAIAAVKSNDFDLILLDIMLPNMDGIELCRQLRKTYGYRRPIIMVTARSSELDKVAGLDSGADDYITKPFSPRELQARIRAHLRRNQSEEELQEPETLIEFAGMTIDAAGYRVEIFGTPVKLTRKEFELLLHLALHPGQTLTREQLLEQVWGYETEINTRTVDEHVRRVRQKLTEAGSAYSYIQTVWGIGYKFEVGAP